MDDYDEVVDALQHIGESRTLCDFCDKPAVEISREFDEIITWQSDIKFPIVVSNSARCKDHSIIR
jgi:hypothetical protein